MSRKVVQVSSSYEAKDGTKKWRNVTVGSAWVKDDGSVSILLDPGISISSSEGVRINIRDPYDRDAPRQGAQRGPQPQPKQQPKRSMSDPADDIPF